MVDSARRLRPERTTRQILRHANDAFSVRKRRRGIQQPRLRADSNSPVRGACAGERYRKVHPAGRLCNAAARAWSVGDRVPKLGTQPQPSKTVVRNKLRPIRKVSEAGRLRGRHDPGVSDDRRPCSAVKPTECTHAALWRRFKPRQLRPLHVVLGFESKCAASRRALRLPYLQLADFSA